MSDAEDWEKLAGDDEQAIAEVLDSHNKFSDEKSVPTKQVLPPPAEPVAQVSSKKSKKTHYEEEDKQAIDPEEKRRRQKLTENADHELTEDLFGSSQTLEELTTEENYLTYAGQVVRGLNKGTSHYHLPIFFKELIRDVADLMDSKQIDEIITHIRVIHSEKVKKEKGPTKVKKNKQVVKGLDKKGGATGFDEEEDLGGRYDEDYEDFF